MRNCAAATHAPVLPAEITTSASPLPASLHMTLMELSGLLRTASTGDSSIAITSVRRDDLVQRLFLGRQAGASRPAVMTFSSPTRNTTSPASSRGAASQHPWRIAAGCVVAAHDINRCSHPGTPSTGSVRRSGLFRLDLQRELRVDEPAVVARAVRELGGAALGAADIMDGLQRVVAPPLALRDLLIRWTGCMDAPLDGGGRGTWGDARVGRQKNGGGKYHPRLTGGIR